MATRFDNTVQPSNSTAALFRAWTQFIHDTLITTGGWVDPGDTGQMDFATVTYPNTVNTKAGYRIYRMNDALQATAPVFIRLDFGGGNAGSGANPGIWVTIGQGSDGAGTIQKIRFNGGAVVSPPTMMTGVAATGAHNNYGSADSGRAQFGLFVNTTSAGRAMVFSIERTKDINGDDTADGLIFMYSTGGSNVDRSRVVLLSDNAQPFEEPGIAYVLSGANPSSFGGDIGVAIPIPFVGVAWPPGVGLLVCRTSDYANESQITMNIYGVSHTYQHQYGYSARNSVASTTDSTSRIFVRYD
jgi:hypothetical protein